jgi:asparagine synthase (glutamine-hydrolysing)
MCGIAGIAGIADSALLRRMTAVIRHRGPDDDGQFFENDAGIGIRRLSIIDVAGGRQPITNEDETLVIVFNGEIYNYRELRVELLARGHRFRTDSDTEVILHLFEDEGPRCLERLNGMWAIAIWDRTRRRLFLARDRLGVKPLYYVTAGHRMLFASEIKSLLEYRDWQPAADPEAIHSYIALRYVPGPGTMLSGARKLPAAHYAIWENGCLTLHRYWSPDAYGGPFPLTDREYLEGFAEEFERSVQMRLMSEVPLGAYLSGGVDSSTIVALMAKLTNSPVRTFTVGFGYERDEFAEAAETARRLGCRHTEVSCRASDLELLPRIIWHLDEPIGDPIVVPMFQLAHEAKKHVTVILAGEGADELLGGYLFHQVLLRAHQAARVVPGVVRRWIVRPALGALPPGVLDLAFDYPAALGTRGKQKVIDFLGLMNRAQLKQGYRHLISLFDERDTQDLYADDFKSRLGAPREEFEPAGENLPLLNRIIDLQFEHWLPDDILTKQDKLSMASGIEVRVPFLDYKLVEYMLRMPPELKIRRGTVKYALREFAKGLMPPDAAGRRKRAFYVPLEKFLQEPKFVEMANDTLSDRVVRERGIFDPPAVARLRNRARSGGFIEAKQVFSLVSLELWHRIMIDQRGTP